MAISIHTIGNSFHVFGAFDVKEYLKSLGARWDSANKSWVLTATPDAARQLDLAFATMPVNRDVGFYRILATGSAAAEHKAADKNAAAAIPYITTSAWAHQRQAFWFGATLPAVMLAMDMGTGKSLVAAAIVRHADAQAVLVCGPLSACGVWAREFSRHLPGQYNVLVLNKGGVAKKLTAAIEHLRLCRARRERSVIAINYESAWREPMADFLIKAAFDALIMDESHRLKTHNGRASKFFTKLAAGIPKRLCLTGTPMPHSPLDIFAQYRALDPSIFGRVFTAFRLHYAVMGGFNNHEVVRFKNLDDLHQRYARIAYRITKDEAIELPPRTDTTREFTLSDRALSVYASLEDHFWAMVEGGEITVANALVELLRLQQCTSGYVKTDDGIESEVDTGKADLLDDIIEDYGDFKKHPLVVFSRFHHDLDKVKALAMLHGLAYGEVSGRQKDLTPHATIPDGIDIMGVQIQSGGVGIDLSRAHTAVYYSIGWSLGDYLQSRDRLHRPGQVNRVTYIHLIAAGTIDEVQYAALQKRQDLVEGVLAGGRHPQQRAVA
jgi:SNF2 family DNA or RNA helicase